MKTFDDYIIGDEELGAGLHVKPYLYYQVKVSKK